MKRENKVAAHITVALVASSRGLFHAFEKVASGSGDAVAIARVAILDISLLATLIVYVRSFMATRRDDLAHTIRTLDCLRGGQSPIRHQATLPLGPERSSQGHVSHAQNSPGHILRCWNI